MIRTFLVRCIVIAAAASLLAVPVAAQTAQGWRSAPEERASFVMNLRDTEIQALAEQVSQITGRTLIVDPAVRGQVTIISTEPLDAEGVWELFQSVLRVHGYAALRAGAVWRIVPQASVNQGATTDRGNAARSQDFVTRLVRLRNLQSDVAARVLRPLVATYGYLEALPTPNAIVITDNAENVRRVESLARTLDSVEGSALESIQLRYASARDVVQVIERVTGDRTQREGSLAPRVAADERSNTVLVRGTPDAVAEVRRLVQSLDKPGDAAAPVTRVFRLNHSDAEAVTAVLRGLLGAPGQASNPVARSLAAGNEPGTTSIIGATSATNRLIGGTTGVAGLGIAGSTNRGGFGLGGSAYGVRPETSPLAPVGSQRATGAAGAGGFSTPEVSVQPAPDLNAIVVRGTPASVADIDSLVNELDLRRPQVLIEVAIVEITGTVAEQLGVQFGIGDAVPPGGIAATSFSSGGLSLRNILGILGVPASFGLVDEGLSVGVRVSNQFGILVQALAQSSKANLLSTPSLTTLDNQPAEIVVGQNVPFRTGSFSTQNGIGAPFTTIERQDVGITMRVVPRVHQGDVIRLEISQEVSSLVNTNIIGAADLITNRRVIQTTVLADNGGTVVLGGLITDDRQSSDSKIPVLGDIPVLGKLFGSERQSRSKQTLFVFLRPTILRDRADLTQAARSKYDRIRSLETTPVAQGSLLFEGSVPKLPLEVEGIY